MRNTKLSTILASTLVFMALPACDLAGIPNIPAPPENVLSITVADEKALYVAASAFQGAQKVAEASVDLGVVKPGSATALKIADLLDKGKALLDKAYALRAAGNKGDLASTVSALMDIVGEVGILANPVK